MRAAPLTMDTPPRVERFHLGPDRRIVAISDIHGNLPYLIGLLAKCALTDRDVIVLVGDLLEKGPDSLGTLRYVMDLSRQREVHTVCGNCDFWQNFCDLPEDPEQNAFYLRYLVGKNRGWGDGLIAQMLREQGMEISWDMDLTEAKQIIREKYQPELDFLRQLPHILQTEQYAFVHGGMVPEKGAFACMKLDAYRQVAKPQKKWTVVGHWPLVLYHEDIVDARPLVDPDLRLISIDGGCVLKDDGQLNAFFLPDMTWTSYDSFPTARVKTAQRENQRHWYIRYGDNEVEILSESEGFCRVRHVRTGYEMDNVPVDFLLKRCGSRAALNDITDYALPLQAGEEISVVRRTSRGILCKKEGISGWYYGDLED